MIFSESSKMNYSIQVPPRDPFENPMTGISSPVFVNNQSFLLNANAGAGGIDSFIDSFSPIHRYLPSNEFPDPDILCDDLDVPVNGFSCDHFRMFDFKVRRCARGRSHDWTECPFAHPGEKARRRDPRKFLYSGTACPEFRKGNCKKGDSCEFAHGIFECWLHPSRYRTQPCKDGIGCRRRVCFFAHSPEQLRVLSGSGDSFILSPTSVLPSPPLSPPSDSQLGGGSFNSMNGLVFSMNNLNLGKTKMGSQWGVEMRQGLSSPNGNLISGNKKYNIWSNNYEEEPVMERVESGRDLRNKMYAKLSKDNSVNQSPLWIPDVDWVSDLLK